MTDSIQTELPDNVLDFFSDVEAVRFAERFVKSYGLSDDEVPSVMNLAEDVVYGDVAIENLPNEIVERFGVDPSKSKQAAIEMAEARLLPIKESVPGVAQQIRAWGGEVELEALPESASLTPELFVRTSLHELVEEMPDYLQARFIHMLEMYVSGHSDRALVGSMMMRSEKVAGLEFEEEDVHRVLDYVDEKMKGKFIAENASIVSVGARPAPPAVVTYAVEPKTENVVVASSVPSPMPEPAPAKLIEKIDLVDFPQKPVTVSPVIPVTPIAQPVVSAPLSEVPKPIVSAQVPQPEKKPLVPLGMTQEAQAHDAHEIAQVTTAKQVAIETPISAPATIEQMVGQICALEPMQLPDGTLADRCKQIVESRFREVRTASDTQQLLERSVETGGLGVSGRKLADMMQAIEKAFDVFAKHAAEKVAQDKMDYLAKQQAQAAEKQTLSDKEEKMMTKRYVELTGKMPDAHVTPVAPSTARTSAAMTQDAALATKEQNIDTAKVRGVIEATKQERDPLQLPLVKGEGLGQARPSVQDVKFVKRLSGPIDELSALSLVDFRRMAKTVDQAIERVSDLVHLVEEQGYEKHVEAVRAWQSSPLYQQYLVIARGAMQEGKPLEEMRSTLEKTTETLTKEELAAILKLNNALRF